MKKVLIILVLGIFFIIPDNVEAESTYTVCSSGCDFTSLEEIYNKYRDGSFSEQNITLDIKGGTYDASRLYSIWNYSDSLTIKGESKENTILINIDAFSNYNDVVNLNIENVTLVLDDSFVKIGIQEDVRLSNIDIYAPKEIENPYKYLFNIDGNNIIIEDVTFNSEIEFNSDSEYSGIYLIGSDNVEINNLTINSNGSMLAKGLVLDDVRSASINNLTVNNSEVGLYVHRTIGDNDHSTINSEIEVNNSNLLNNTCSSFNILDDEWFEIITDNKYSGLIAYNLPFTSKKSYQVVFNKNNLLNCAVASGTDTNTYVSGENTWEEEPISYTYDEIDYDNLTNTVQNVNNGTVDVVKNYKGTVTIEEGSSVDDDTAFEEELNLDGVTWTSNDESIARIENGKILGLKEGTTTITGVSSDGLTTYEIVVNVVKNPVTNSMIYVGIGVILILVLGTALYTVYRIKTIVKED